MLVLGACSGSSSGDGDGDSAGAPTTIDASAIEITPDDAEAVLTTASTVASVTVPPAPLTPEEEVAAAAAVGDFHLAVAESFAPVDPDNAALAATTTPEYLETLQGLLQTLADSGQTVEPGYEADIVTVSVIDDGIARVDLCERDNTRILDATGAVLSESSGDEVVASFLVVIRDDDQVWRVDGGGLDQDRTCE